jgi:thiol:disulfide interchange protein DsbA
MLLFIVGVGDTSQTAWAQDEMAMGRECAKAHDLQCKRACLEALKKRGDPAECRTAYNEMKARQPETANDQAANEHPVLQIERRLVEREPEIRAEFEAELKRIKPGLVYRTKAYWTERLVGDNGTRLLQTDSRTSLLETTKDTFDGVFYTKGASTSDFPLLYRGFTRAYGKRCSDSMEDPISITITRTETDQFGFEKEEVAAPFLVEKSFYEKFDAYEPLAIEHATRTGMRMALNGAAMSAIQEAITVHDDTMDTILSRIPCASATMRQLRMNVWLRAHGRPSLQDSGDSVAGSESETEADQLRSQIADFDTRMANAKDASNREVPYSIINPPTRVDGEQGIEIAYLYNYYAKSCWPFESHIKTWLQQKDASIQFVRVPAASTSDRLSAYGYYVAQHMDMAETINNAIFEGIYVNKRAPAAYDLMSELFEKQGVDTSAFDEAMKLSSVKESVAKAEKLHSGYSPIDMPVFVVNGKYRVSTKTCRCGPEEMLAIVTELAKSAD